MAAQSSNTSTGQGYNDDPCLYVVSEDEEMSQPDGIPPIWKEVVESATQPHSNMLDTYIDVALGPSAIADILNEGEGNLGASSGFDSNDKSQAGSADLHQLQQAESLKILNKAPPTDPESLEDNLTSAPAADMIENANMSEQFIQLPVKVVIANGSEVGTSPKLIQAVLRFPCSYFDATGSSVCATTDDSSCGDLNTQNSEALNIQSTDDLLIQNTEDLIIQTPDDLLIQNTGEFGQNTTEEFTTENTEEFGQNTTDEFTTENTGEFGQNTTEEFTTENCENTGQVVPTETSQAVLAIVEKSIPAPVVVPIKKEKGRRRKRPSTASMSSPPLVKNTGGKACRSKAEPSPPAGKAAERKNTTSIDKKSTKATASSSTFAPDVVIVRADGKYHINGEKFNMWELHDKLDEGHPLKKRAKNAKVEHDRREKNKRSRTEMKKWKPMYKKKCAELRKAKAKISKLEVANAQLKEEKARETARADLAESQMPRGYQGCPPIIRDMVGLIKKAHPEALSEPENKDCD